MWEEEPAHLSWLFTSTSADGTVRLWSARDWTTLHVFAFDEPNPQDVGEWGWGWGCGCGRG